MNTFEGEDKVSFVLQGLRVAESKIGAEEWWDIICKIIEQIRDMIPQLLGYTTVKDMLVYVDPVEFVTRENEGVSIYEKGIGPQTRCFPLFNEKIYDNMDGGLVKHFLLSYNGRLILWQERYETPEARLQRVLTSSNFSFISAESFNYLTERQLSRSHGILGIHILAGIVALIKKTVEEKERRQAKLRTLLSTLNDQIGRIDSSLL